MSYNALPQARHVSVLASGLVFDIAQEFPAVCTLAGWQEGDVHPAGVRAFGRVVALADDLVEVGEILPRPLGKGQGGKVCDFYVAGAAGGVLAGARPGGGFVLERPFQGLPAEDAVR